MSFLAHVAGGAMAGLGQGLGAAAKMKYESDLEAKRQEILAQREEALVRLKDSLEQPNREALLKLKEREVTAAEAAGRSKAENDMLRNQVSFLGQVARLGGASGSGGKSDKLDPTSFIAIEQDAIKNGMPAAEASIHARERATVMSTDRDGSRVIAYNHNGRPMEIARLPANATAEQQAAFQKKFDLFIEKGLRGLGQAEEKGAEGKGFFSGISEVAGKIGDALSGGKPTSPEEAARADEWRNYGKMSPEEKEQFAARARAERDAKATEEAKASEASKKKLREEWERLDLSKMSGMELAAARAKYWSVLSPEEQKQIVKMVR